jgi:hypothetical protein
VQVRLDKTRHFARLGHVTADSAGMHFGQRVVGSAEDPIVERPRELDVRGFCMPRPVRIGSGAP